MRPSSFRRALRVFTLTVTAGAVLALPAAAFACGGGGTGGDNVVSAIAVLAAGGGGPTGDNVVSAVASLHVL